jgi:predicted regulator of Ras-like GTPase activity (Roadblock/LC7/MglB family)
MPVANDAPALPSSETISLPLAKIIARLPNEVQAAVITSETGDLHVALPLAEILAQLPRGVVRVPFGIIRHASPSGCFTPHTNFDPVPVTLPLDEIVSRISPSQLPRRAPRKRIEVPDSVPAPFQSGTSRTESYSAPAVPPAPVASPEPVSPPTPIEVPIKIETPAPAPVAPVSVEPPQPAPVATPVVAAPVAPPAPAPAPATASAEPRRETSFFRAGNLVLPVNRLINNWPQPVLLEISRANLANEPVEMPLTLIETGLRQGRLTFSWKQLRDWMPGLPKPHAESPNDALELELPLRIIAPLYLSQRTAQPRTRVNVGQNIPDLFGPGTLTSDTSLLRKLEAESSRPATVPGVNVDVWEAQTAPTANAPARKSLPSVESVVGTAAAPAGSLATSQTSFLARNTIDAIFEEPGKTSWTAMDVVRKTSRLKGVAGACMFTQDGLLVAEQYPALVGVDTFCALVTQMYNRVFGHAMELRLGGPTRLGFVAEGVSYETFKCGRVYFTVISQPGEKLPLTELLVIADHLTRQSR